MAALHYLRGTNIGGEPTEQQHLGFIDRVLDGTDTTAPEQPHQKVTYNAGFRPFSIERIGMLLDSPKTAASAPS
jgi:hypothetical protein